MEFFSKIGPFHASRVHYLERVVKYKDTNGNDVGTSE